MTNIRYTVLTLMLRCFSVYGADAWPTNARKTYSISDVFLLLGTHPPLLSGTQPTGEALTTGSTTRSGPAGRLRPAASAGATGGATGGQDRRSAKPRRAYLPVI